ncbi:MAG: hypothetical protein AB1813_00820 [Verrucomicrobiota bacterium]
MKRNTNPTDKSLKRKLLLGWFLTLTAAVWSVYEWGFVNNGPQYFLPGWRRIASVFVLSVCGGLLVYSIMQLPENVRRRIASAGFGMSALLNAALWLWLLWIIIAARESLAATGMLGWSIALVTFLFLLGVGLQAMMWWHFKKPPVQSTEP